MFHPREKDTLTGGIFKNLKNTDYIYSQSWF